MDDNLNDGTSKFEELTQLTLDSFDAKPRAYDSFSFFEKQIDTVGPSMFQLAQSHYCRSLTPLAKDASMGDFRRRRGLLAWLAHLRPELSSVTYKSRILR